MSLDLKESKKFAIGLAKDAGEIMLEYFYSGNFEIEYKEDKTPVTIADKKINQLVIDAVARAYPKHAVQGEEGSVIKNSNYMWVCDPIDGTVPFLKQIPIAAFSLALVYDGKPVVGVVYDPFGERLISAVHGNGAFLNDEKISVSQKKLDIKATINIEWWPEAEKDVFTSLHNLSKENAMYHIHLPSIVYAGMLVATGELEACVFPGTKEKNVDIAALKIIVEEAGGEVTDLDGNEQRYDRDINGAVISNGIVHDDITIALKPVAQHLKNQKKL